MNRDLKQHRKIQIELRKKKIKKARGELKTGENLIIHTNKNMETFAFGKKKNGDIRTIMYLGHTNEKLGKVTEW